MDTLLSRIPFKVIQIWLPSFKHFLVSTKHHIFNPSSLICFECRWGMSLNFPLFVPPNIMFSFLNDRSRWLMPQKPAVHSDPQLLSCSDCPVGAPSGLMFSCVLSPFPWMNHSAKLSIESCLLLPFPFVKVILNFIPVLSTSHPHPNGYHCQN